MIDEIFELIMKEARARPGKDLITKINTVLLEVSDRVISTQENMKESERRHGRHED